MGNNSPLGYGHASLLSAGVTRGRKAPDEKKHYGLLVFPASSYDLKCRKIAGVTVATRTGVHYASHAADDSPSSEMYCSSYDEFTDRR